MTDLLREETYYNDLTYKECGTSRINNNNKIGIKQADFLSCNVHANKTVQNTVDQNEVGGEVITGEDMIRRRGKLYYDLGETLLRLRGDFLMGETISRDMPAINHLYWA